jgi:hypothetical protein
MKFDIVTTFFSNKEKIKKNLKKKKNKSKSDLVATTMNATINNNNLINGRSSSSIITTTTSSPSSSSSSQFSLSSHISDSRLFETNQSCESSHLDEDDDGTSLSQSEVETKTNEFVFNNYDEIYNSNVVKVETEKRAHPFQKASLIEDIINRRKSTTKTTPTVNINNDNKMKLVKPTDCVINSDDYKYFINAVDKLKADDLFTDITDFNTLSDDQIYNKLVKHAREQKTNNNSLNKRDITVSSLINGNHQTTPSTIFSMRQYSTSSIDENQEDQDLPIIMRNLHSVKSLKHYFELRAKTSILNTNIIANSEEEVPIKINNQCVINEPQYQMCSIEKKIESNNNITKSEDITVISVNPPPPPPPPLPQFLLVPPVEHKISDLIKMNKKQSDNNNDSVSSSIKSERDGLHDKLVQEIHNKSLERSKKQSSIRLDNYGNIIHTNRSAFNYKNNNRTNKLKIPAETNENEPSNIHKMIFY